MVVLKRSSSYFVLGYYGPNSSNVERPFNPPNSTFLARTGLLDFSRDLPNYPYKRPGGDEVMALNVFMVTRSTLSFVRSAGAAKHLEI
jgi:hypothetical protein